MSATCVHSAALFLYSVVLLVNDGWMDLAAPNGRRASLAAFVRKTALSNYTLLLPQLAMGRRQKGQLTAPSI